MILYVSLIISLVPKFLIEKIISSKIPWKEKGFMSVSLTNLFSIVILIKKGYEMLKIFVSKGTCVLYVDIVSGGENEMILPPNCFLNYLHHTYRDKETGNNVFLCKLIQLL